MQVKLNIGGIGIGVNCVEHYEISEILTGFMDDDLPKDVEIDIVFESQEKKSQLPMIGEDLFCRYHGQGKEMEIELKGSNQMASGMIFCDKEMKRLKVELYQQMQSGKKVLDRLLALLPIRRILSVHQAFLMHSSRIEVNGKAILFSGPSGIGKTTQALLWAKYEKAPYLCNDRCILRYQDQQWNTYGYFQDGSAPIADNRCLPLGAIVFLKQGTENIVKKTEGKEALKRIMGQAFMDSWDASMITDILGGAMSLIQDIPIYTLQCLPEYSAVECLKEKLEKEVKM